MSFSKAGKAREPRTCMATGLVLPGRDELRFASAFPVAAGAASDPADRSWTPSRWPQFLPPLGWREALAQTQGGWRNKSGHSKRICQH